MVISVVLRDIQIDTCGGQLFDDQDHLGGLGVAIIDDVLAAKLDEVPELIGKHIRFGQSDSENRWRHIIVAHVKHSFEEHGD